jgi:hypothetical protein
VSGQLDSGCLHPVGTGPLILRIGGWVGPKSRSECGKEKNTCTDRNRMSAIQPIASHFAVDYSLLGCDTI